MSSQPATSDVLTGTVKGPGERPQEYLFITADNVRARIGEFVYYMAHDGESERHILGNITSRRLVRNLPDTFLSDPQTPPAIVSSLIGLNSRLDALQAAVLRVKLPHLDRWSEARKANAERYDQLFTDAGLAEELILPSVRSNVRHIFNQYVMRAPGRRDALVKHLKESGVGTEIYYPLPLHLQECFSHLGYKEGDFPLAEQAARETLALPVYPELRPEQQHYVVETIRSFYRS